MILWKGHHSVALIDLLANAWASDELIILCPPTLKNFAFIQVLAKCGVPITDLEVRGDFSSEERDQIKEQSKALTSEVNSPTPARAFVKTPVVGVFTSGTLSGNPRLVLYSKGNIEFSVESIRSFFDTSEIEELFCYPPPFHTFGLILGYYHAILHGLRLHVPEGRYSRESHFLRAQVHNRKLLTLGTPSHFYDLIEHTKSSGASLPESYTCIIGGAKVSVSLWTQLQNDLKIQSPSIGYGATEASPGVSHHPPGLMPKEEGEIGHPLPGVQIHSMGQKGLHFSGKNVCLAIIENEQIQFPESILLHDFIEERGSDKMLLFRGRLGLLLNRGGTKYSLESLEELFKKELGYDCVCFAIASERLVEDLGILVASGPNVAATLTQELRASFQHLLKQEFQHQFQLDKFKVTSALPLNENGKIDRSQISKIMSAT
jgi:acyl-CoA synthetase (AMP-forming)/AMP-acid ligase II